MITLRKLASLPERTRGRKVLLLVQEFKRRLLGGTEGAALSDDEALFVGEAVALVLGAAVSEGPAGREPLPLDLRTLTHWQSRLEAELGLSQADWDLQTPGDRTAGETTAAGRLPLAVWLEDLRSPFNVGSILRTAEAYGFEAVYLSPHCPPVDHPRVQRTAMGAAGLVKIEVLSLSELQVKFESAPVFALELGGTAVQDFAFPARGVLLVGSEELGLSPEALAWADSKNGRVTLELTGTKASLNVGVAFGIAANSWVTRR